MRAYHSAGVPRRFSLRKKSAPATGRIFSIDYGALTWSRRCIRRPQKYLGTVVGFPEKSADVRLAQYESGTRTPKADLTAALAQALDVAPQALSVPDIDSQIGLMHTLFALEDVYGITIREIAGEVCLRINQDK